MAKLPEGIDHDRRRWTAPSVVLTILSMIGVIASLVWYTSAETADLKRRVTTLEKGENKTHALIKETSRELKRDAKETKDSVNQILQELSAMRALERKRENDRVRRDGQ